MNDTIAAIATPLAPSAIGIVRLSGPEALQVLERVFVPRGKPLRERQPGTLIFGQLRDEEGRVLDECLATFSRAPHSYTGEDTAELQCHGSAAVLRGALESLFRAGARQARAGEFTRRAFLNGKLDLIQAEAVIDLIDAQTPQAARNAAGQLSGAIGGKIDAIYRALTDISSHYHAVLDYPDEDIEDFQLRSYASTLVGAEEQLNALLRSFERGRLLRSGLPCAIIGRPNVGKSSLTNRLAKRERSIVSDVAGTTRDAVDTLIEWKGNRIRLVDTAGMRKKTQVHEDVEYYSLVRGLGAMDRADVCLLVVDASVGVTEQDQKLAGMAIDRGCAIVIVLNKWDLIDSAEERERVESSRAQRMTFATWAPSVNVSALTGRAVDKVLAAAVEAARTHATHIKTSQLNNLITQIREGGHTVTDKGRRLKIHYATQTGERPPAFTFWCNAHDLVDDNYERFLENRLRETFDLVGTPIRLKFRRKDDK
jgi:tRNA modification GTPase TrmE